MQARCSRQAGDRYGNFGRSLETGRDIPVRHFVTTLDGVLHLIQT